MAMTSKERQQVLILVIILLVAGAAGFWIYWRGPKVEQQQALRTEVDSLRAQVDSARADLDRGTVQSIRQQTADFEAMLVRMRDLVPTNNEVAQILDDISSRARRGGINIAEFDPLTAEVGETFDVHRSRWTVYGYYNEIGVLMSDIAQLSRIMVPYDLQLTIAQENDARAYGDTTGALVRARFMLRTFVKPQTSAQGADG